MESGTGVYASILNGLTAHAARSNPQLAVEALRSGIRTLDRAGVKYRLDGATLYVNDDSDASRKAMYELILSYSQALEEAHGVNETWKELKIVMAKVLGSSRDAIREYDIEIPVFRCSAEYQTLDTLFGFNSGDFRTRGWFSDPILITNKKVVFPKGGNPIEVPFNAIATIGREVYVGYVTDVRKGIVRAIDYQIREGGMSCAVIVAKEELMKDLMDIIRIIRADYRRLSLNEVKALVELYGGTSPAMLSEKTGLAPTEALLAFRRLRQLNYCDNTGHFTSYGINAYIEVMQAKQ